MSVITKSELLYGVEVSPRRVHDATALQAFLPHVEVLEFPNDAAAHYAQMHAELKRRGQIIGANDLFIAAHARSLGLRLVTNNIAEFGRVKGLTLENWAVPFVVLVRETTNNWRPTRPSLAREADRAEQRPKFGLPPPDHDLIIEQTCINAE